MQKYHLVLLLFIPPFFACQQAEESGGIFPENFPDAAAADKEPTPKNIATDIIFQSTDGGLTWQDMSVGLPIDVKANGFFAAQDELYLRGEKALYRSNTASKQPVWEKDDFYEKPGAAFFMGKAGMLASATGGSLFQKTKGTDTWLPFGLGFKGHAIHSIFETPEGNFIVGCDNGIFKSTDQGRTWKHVYYDGWVIKIVGADGVLVCTNERGILRSTDGGEHWDLVIDEGGVGIAVERITGGFAAINYNKKMDTRRVRISTDAGKTWQAIDEGFPPSQSISSIVQMGGYLFCGHPDGVYRSANLGKTWELLLPSLGKKIFNLTASENVIYALPQEGGC